MKKTLLTLFCAMAAMVGIAQSETTYTEPLIVTINGESGEPQDAEVTVITNADGSINFSLHNFILKADVDEIPVGTIYVENIATEQSEDGLTHFAYKDNLIIKNGDLEGVEVWMGPLLGEIPLDLSGKLNDEHLYVSIDIDMQSAIGQIVNVKVGSEVFGTTYTEQYTVSANGGDPTAPADVTLTVVDNGDETIDLVLRDFSLTLAGQEISMGDVTLENVSTKQGEDGVTSFSKESTFNIPAESVPQQYAFLASMGAFSNIPYALQGKYDDTKLYATIDINVALLGQRLFVEVGTDDFTAALTGDLNADGKVDIADAVSVLNIMAEDGNSNEADINGDGKVDIADFVSILNIMAEQ